MATPTMIPAGWYTDPAHRHEYRYWSGTDWTALVSDNAVTATDLLPSSPPSPVPESAPTAHLPEPPHPPTALPPSPPAAPGSSIRVSACAWVPCTAAPG
jgi:hypothetical protein